MKPPSTTRPCGILIVDDDADLASTLGEFLQQEGYAVEVALSAAEALALQERNPYFSVALVDLVMPLTDGLLFVHNALLGCGLRGKIRVICSGKIVTGFNMVQRIAIGADLCNSARAMMFALGCIQALKCNTNHCPVGVTTQNPDLVRGLDVAGKKHRVCNYHRNTVNSFLEILGAAGLSHPDELRPRHIQRRVSPTEVQDYGRIYQYLEPGALFSASLPSTFSEAWEAASAERF